MNAKRMVRKVALAAVVLAAATMTASVAGAVQEGGGGGAKGLASAYQNESFSFELGAVNGQGTNPQVCVKVASKASGLTAEGCGPVKLIVHPTLEVATVEGTVEGKLYQTSNRRVLNKSVPISLDLYYQAVGMYDPFVLSPQTELWLYPMDVAAAQGAGIARAAWGWGSVKAPMCKQSSAAAIRNRTPRNVLVTCGLDASGPQFAGRIAQTLTASAGLAM